MGNPSSDNDRLAGVTHPFMVDHVETEWQFDADDLSPVEDWLREHPSASGFAILPEASRGLTDTYYDTEDWRFYRAGYALRVRRAGESVEATMKSLSPAEDGVRRRREISEPLSSAGPKTLKRARGPVGERLRALVGARDLRPLFEVRTRRRVFELRPDGPSADSSASVGEVTLDESEFFGHGEGPTRLRRVEVEVGAEPRDGVSRFVDELRGSPGLRPAEASKFELGLSAAGLNPSGVADLDLKQRTERTNEKAGG
jgi:inorganic triphosphatase YgiF